MQKHPTPTRRGGDFHWHPATVPAGIRAALGDLVTRYRGQRVSVWIIDADYVAWARVFSAVSPAEQRRYTGLAVTLAQPAGHPRGTTGSAAANAWLTAVPEILARMPLAAPGPFAKGTPDRAQRCAIAMPNGAVQPLWHTLWPVDPDRLATLVEPTHLARAVYFGGPGRCAAPYDEQLPAVLASLLSWLPRSEQGRPRQGAFADSDPASGHGAPGLRGAAGAAAGAAGADNLLHYLTQVWFCPAPIRHRWPGFSRRAWRLVLELAASLNRPLPALLGDLGEVAAVWGTADELRQYLLGRGILHRTQVDTCNRRAPRPLFAASVADAGWLWSRLLHYWGRGFLPVDQRQLQRLAALLAQRVAVDHLFHLDAPDQVELPGRYLRRLTCETLLPRQHVDAMMRAVEQYAPSLVSPPEVPRA